jgi:hypothetical protein
MNFGVGLFIVSFEIMWKQPVPAEDDLPCNYRHGR